MKKSFLILVIPALVLSAVVAGNASFAQSAPIIETQWIGDYNTQDDAIAATCPAGWTDTKLLDDNGKRDTHHIGEEESNGGIIKLCIRASDPEITLSATWGGGYCPAGMNFMQVYDDAGSYSHENDKPWKHSLNEENNRPDGSYYHMWCMGASGGDATEVQARWVQWSSSTYNPPCAADETRLISSRKGYRNVNTNDINGNRQESLCAKIITETTSAPAPTASLAADPASIVSGETSTLTWSSTNANSCTGTNFSTGGATSGTVTVSPTATTAYSVTCTGDGGSADASATVTVSASGGSIVASCSVSPASIALNGSATWTATASGGNGTFTYAWTGTDGLTGTAASVTKAYTSSGTKTASVTVTSGSESVTQACANSLTVSGTPVAPGPDLVAGMVSPDTAVAGTPVTLSSIISNLGDQPTGASFTDLFQLGSGSSPLVGAVSYVADIGTYSSAALAAGISNTATRSYTFTSAGVHYVRACADKSSAGSAGTIAESNEVNNCGAWTAITVSPDNDPNGPTLSCSPSTTNVAVGGSVTYTALPGAGVTGPYSWTDSDGTVGIGNTYTRTYSVPGTYQMRVQSLNAGPSYCSPSVVTVGAQYCSGTPTLSIEASPMRVQAGETSQITWSASGVPGANPSCTVSGPGVSQTVAAGGLPACSIPNGSANPTINTQSTYTITCGGASDSVTVNVIPAFEEF